VIPELNAAVTGAASLAFAPPGAYDFRNFVTVT
jgi:hypothetical protein